MRTTIILSCLFFSTNILSQDITISNEKVSLQKIITEADTTEVVSVNFDVKVRGTIDCIGYRIVPYALLTNGDTMISKNKESFSNPLKEGVTFRGELDGTFPKLNSQNIDELKSIIFMLEKVEKIPDNLIVFEKLNGRRHKNETVDLPNKSLTLTIKEIDLKIQPPEAKKGSILDELDIPLILKKALPLEDGQTLDLELAEEAFSEEVFIHVFSGFFSHIARSILPSNSKQKSPYVKLESNFSLSDYVQTEIYDYKGQRLTSASSLGFGNSFRYTFSRSSKKNEISVHLYQPKKLQKTVLHTVQISN